eukprot:1150924-Pelagomonas_calceolata.AAC.3
MFSTLYLRSQQVVVPPAPLHPLILAASWRLLGRRLACCRVSPATAAPAGQVACTLLSFPWEIQPQQHHMHSTRWAGGAHAACTSGLQPVPSVQMAHMPPAHQGPSQPEEDPDARGGGQIAEEMRRCSMGDKMRKLNDANERQRKCRLDG